MNADVTAYIDKQPAWQADIARRLRQIAFEAVPDAEERLQYGKPHYLKNGKYAFVISTAKGWVNFLIFNATNLQAPDGFFEPSDAPERKVIKIREGQTVDYDLLASLAKQAANG